MGLRIIDKDEAKKQFEGNLKRLFDVFAIDPKYDIIECHDVNPKKYVESIMDGKINTAAMLYPSLRSPVFCCKIDSKEFLTIIGQIDVANYIFQEINFVNPIKFNAKKGVVLGNPISKNDHEFYYREKAYLTAIEMGICLSLGGFPMYALLEKLKAWAQKTYEGRKVAFSFIVDPSLSASSPKVNIINFLEENHAAVFTDGITSCITLDKDGNVVNYICADTIESAQSKKVYPYAPFRFQNLCSRCQRGKIGIVLQSNGDILLFRQNNLLCARVEGKWQILNLDSVIHQLQCGLVETSEIGVDEQAKQIVLSLLDVSFAHSGGCLAVIQKGEDQAKQLYCNDDFQRFLAEEPDKTSTKAERDKHIKIWTLQRIVDKDKKFYALDRKLRQEMMALDGATVIDKKGTLLAIGSIIRVEGGSEEGGRLAATKALSKFGIAIKISADGKIVAYQNEEEIFRIF